jgi:hypothetical protein
MPDGRSFRSTAATVLVYAVAMAYLEAAVVVYLTLALGGQVGVLFPLRPAIETGNLVAIEVGREAATLVMIAAAGMLAGRTGLERLAWHRRWPRPDRSDPYRSASTTTRSPHVKEMRASRPGFRLTP